MKRVFLALALAAGTAVAAPPPAAKIGYIDLQRTLNETKVGKAAKAKLESDKTEKQKQVNDKKDMLKKAYDDLEKQRVVLKPDALAKKEKELQDQYVELQQVFMQLQQDLSKREAQLTRDIFGKAAAIIENIAKRDGYTMILEKSESAVLWADANVDITSEVNRRMDAGEGQKPDKPEKAEKAEPGKK
ncbi:MAG TPA: OmpH family outer membrane protein [Haliangiales bacterium]|nr:OmpH family outer membrane protein [Haliangiales bacterium]